MELQASVRGLVALLAMSLVVATAAAILALSVAACDTAVDRTRRTGHHGLDTMESSGNDNVQVVAGNMMSELTKQLGERMLRYFATPAVVATALGEFLSAHPYTSVEQVEWMNTTMRPVLYTQFLAANKQGVTEAAVVSKTTAWPRRPLENDVTDPAYRWDDDGYWTLLIHYSESTTFTYPFDPGITHKYYTAERLANHTDGKPLELGQDVAALGTPGPLGHIMDTGRCSLVGYPTGRCPGTFANNQRKSKKENIEEDNQFWNKVTRALPGKVQWAPLKSFGPVLSLMAFIVIRSGGPVTRESAFQSYNAFAWASIDVSAVSLFMSAAHAELPAEWASSRVYATQRNPWDDTSGVLVGCSHGQAWVTEGAAMMGMPVNRMAISAAQAEDGLTRSHAVHVAEVSGGAMGIVAGQLLEWWDGSIKYWFVKHDVDDGLDLVMHVFLIVRRDDVMRASDETTRVARRTAEAADDATQRDRRAALSTTLGVASAAVAVLTLLAAGAAQCVTAPLTSLQDELRDATELRIDPEPKPLSRLVEIRKVQLACQMLLHTINEYRPYLPQSVLQAIFGGFTDSSYIMEDSFIDEGSQSHSGRGSGSLSGRFSASRASSNTSRFEAHEYSTGHSIIGRTVASLDMTKSQSHSPAHSPTGRNNPRSPTKSGVSPGPSQRHSQRDGPEQQMSFQSDADVLRSVNRSGRTREPKTILSLRGEPASLQLAVKLEKRTVSLVCINVRRYHMQLEQCDPVRLVFFHELLVEMFLTVCKPSGTVDSVAGDRGRVAFNAARFCVGHRGSAALCALNASTLPSSVGGAHLASHAVVTGGRFAGAGDIRLSAGAACGIVLAGNVGAGALRCFNLIGTLCGWAHALERLSAQGLGPSVVDGAVSDQTGAASLISRVVPVLVRHWRHQPGSARRLWAIEGSLRGTLSSGDAANFKEWMYKQDDDANANPWRVYNQAAEAYLVGSCAAALRALSVAWREEQQRRVDELLALLDAAEEVHHGGGPAAPEPVLLRDAAALPHPSAPSGGVAGGVRELIAATRAQEAELQIRRAAEQLEQQGRVQGRVDEKRRAKEERRTVTGTGTGTGMSIPVRTLSPAPVPMPTPPDAAPPPLPPLVLPPSVYAVAEERGMELPTGPLNSSQKEEIYKMMSEAASIEQSKIAGLQRELNQGCAKGRVSPTSPAAANPDLHTTFRQLEEACDGLVQINGALKLLQGGMDGPKRQLGTTTITGKRPSSPDAKRLAGKRSSSTEGKRQHETLYEA